MIIKAYKALVGEDVKLVLEGTTLDGVIWLDDRPQPSNSDVQAKITELQNEYNNNQYQRNREIEYPSIQEQLDLQYHDQVNGTTKWKDKIKSIKDKYPKPSEE